MSLVLEMNYVLSKLWYSVKNDKKIHFLLLLLRTLVGMGNKASARVLVLHLNQTEKHFHLKAEYSIREATLTLG